MSASLLAACGRDADAAPVKVCDIREPPCQRRAAELAAFLRGSTGALPEVEVVVKDAAAFIGEAEAAARLTAVTPRERAFRAGLRTFGASEVPTDYGSDVRARYEQTGAIYSHAERRITVFDRGEKMDDAEAFALLVHEMTHALQGADGVFERAKEAKTDDAWLARRAMTEGEATHAELRAYAYVHGWDGGQVDWEHAIGNVMGAVAEAVRSSRDLYRDRIMLFPYAWGLRFVHDAHFAGGADAVLSLHAEGAPSSTAEVMRGYHDVLRGRGSSVRDVPTPRLVDPWRASSVSHLGAWLLAQVAARRGESTFWARSVLGDSLTILEAPTDQGAPDEPAIAAVWRIEGADATVAAEAARALASTTEQPDGLLIPSPTSPDAAVVLTGAVGVPRGGSRELLEWEPPAQEDLFYETAQPKGKHRDDELACPRSRIDARPPEH